MPEEKKGQPERLPHETGAVTFRPFHGSWRPWSALTEPEGDQNETNAAPCYQTKVASKWHDCNAGDGPGDFVAIVGCSGKGLTFANFGCS